MSPEAAPTRGSLIASRVLKRFAFYPFLIASLLVFPSWVPWMALGWLGAAWVRMLKRRPVWPPLALLGAMILVKRVDVSPHLLVFLAALAIAGILDAVRHRNPLLGRFANGALGWLFAMWVLFLIGWRTGEHTDRQATLAADRPVVCIGDSLLSGGFARELEKKIRVPVVDLAQGGITAKDGLKLIPEMQKANPQAVIVELGGHDSLRGRTRSEAKADLEAILAAARDSGAEVFLFEIPLGFISDPYWGLQRELARKHDLELVSDGAIRQLVYFSPFTPLGRWTGRLLSYDGLHPNEFGNALMAERAVDALVRVYGGAIRR